jgi:integrase
MRWTDVDFAEKTIVIPGGRYKTTRPHLVALSRQALALLEGLPRFTGPFVFSTTGGEKAIGGFGWMKRNIDALLDPPIDYDLHDLRRTCRTGMARLRVADHVAAWVLGRSVGGIQRVYNLHGYLDEKRQALQLWADHVEAVVTGRRAKVVPLHREAQ